MNVDSGTQTEIALSHEISPVLLLRRIEVELFTALIKRSSEIGEDAQSEEVHTNQGLQARQCPNPSDCL